MGSIVYFKPDPLRICFFIGVLMLLLAPRGLLDQIKKGAGLPPGPITAQGLMSDGKQASLMNPDPVSLGGFNTRRESPKIKEKDNNLFGIEFTNASKKEPWVGQVKADIITAKSGKQRFVSFDDPENSVRASTIIRLKHNLEYGDKTVEDLVNKYTPIAEKNDAGEYVNLPDFPSYVNKVAKDIGVDWGDNVDLRDKKTLINFMRSTGEVEAGKDKFHQSIDDASFRRGVERGYEYIKNKYPKHFTK